MKILITGYRGFIGQNMLAELMKYHEVSTYDWGEEFPDIKNLDWVVHLGAISSTTETDVEKVMRQNYDFSKRLLNYCKFWNVNLQYASSASVYGLNQDFREDAPINPQSPYAWSKYLFDRYAQSNTGSIIVQGFRYFNVYGPFEEHKGNQASPYYKFTQQAKSKGEIELFEGSENYYRDFVPVKTVIDVHKTFFDVHESGIWNVGTGTAKSFQSVAEEIAQKYSAKIKYIPMPENIRKQYQSYTQADITKLRKHYNP